MAIPAPVLTVTNNEDSTATFDITGGDAGAFNDIYLSTAQQPLGWSLVASVTGNGSTGPIAINPGLYWAVAKALAIPDSEVSLPIPFIATASSTAVFEQIMQAVVSKLQVAADLGTFGDMDNTRIVRQDVVILDRLTCGLPCIIVTPGFQETEGESTTTSDDIVYPVLVGIYDAKEDKEEGNTPSYFLWREGVRQLFSRKHLPGINRSVMGTVQPQVILDHKDSGEELYGFSSSVQLLFTVREVRWA